MPSVSADEISDIATARERAGGPTMRRRALELRPGEKEMGRGGESDWKQPRASFKVAGRAVHKVDNKESSSVPRTRPVD